MKLRIFFFFRKDDHFNFIKPINYCFYSATNKSFLYSARHSFANGNTQAQFHEIHSIQ